MAINRTLLNDYMASAFRGPFEKMAEKCSAFLLDKNEAAQTVDINAWKAAHKTQLEAQKAAADARAAALATKIAGL